MTEHYLTPAQKLFGTKFCVHVQNRAFYTAHEIEEIGFVSAGTEKDNESYLNSYRLVQAIVPQIAEWNYRGEGIKLVDLNDAKKMYRLIVDHLDTWINVSTIHPYVKYPPIDDIEALDAVAELLHPLVDVELEMFDDPVLMLMFGNAVNFGYTIPGNELKEPYERYAPKLYPYTQPRWAR